jgi:hypothetical protein
MVFAQTSTQYAGLADEPIILFADCGETVIGFVFGELVSRPELCGKTQISYCEKVAAENPLNITEAIFTVYEENCRNKFLMRKLLNGEVEAVLNDENLTESLLVKFTRADFGSLPNEAAFKFQVKIEDFGLKTIAFGAIGFGDCVPNSVICDETVQPASGESNCGNCETS